MTTRRIHLPIRLPLPHTVLATATALIALAATIALLGLTTGPN